MGLGFTEMLFIAGTIALLFGPGAVLVWWFMTQARASRSAETDTAPEHADDTDAQPENPVLTAAADSLAQGAITQDQYDEIERTLA